MGRHRTIGRLEEHPNLGEILGVLGQLAHIADSDLPLLTKAWVNSPTVASARDRALSADSPLVLEVLAGFEAVQSLFADDLAGEAAYVTIHPAITSTALKAVRDAIAAAYAKPVLSRSEHALLMKPWRTVYGSSRGGETDLGPQAAAVKALLSVLPRLAARCHDQASAQLYEDLVNRSFVDESGRAGARDSAFQAAVLTSRRRVWLLVRRSGTEGLSRQCSACGRRAEDQGEATRVLMLCLDAACALLVADATPDEVTELLTAPVRSLIPQQR